MNYKLLFLFFISTLLYSSCGSPRQNIDQPGDFSVLSKADTLAILKAILTHRDTLYVPDGYDGIVRLLTFYGKVDSLSFINNEHFKYGSGSSLEIDGKTLLFIEPPLRYPKDHDVQDRPDLSFTWFKLTADTLDCTLYSLYGGSFWDFMLTRSDEGNWVVTRYGEGRF